MLNGKIDKMKRSAAFVVVLAALGCARTSYGLATERIGPTSAQGRPMPEQSGLLGHPSRVYSRWVNGNESFYFKSTPAEINDLIRLFSQARVRDHELWIKAGKPRIASFRGDEIDYNVEFHVVGGIVLSVYRVKETPDTYDPTLTVYVDPSADRALLGQVTLPANIILHNEAANSPLESKATKPARRVWYARVQFNDSTPAVDLEHGVSTNVTLWEKDVREGICLGDVNREGCFHAAFSDKEIADLKTDRSWLTLTVGNGMTEASRDHPRLSINQLALDKTKAPPVKLPSPPFYYGRILFTDGVPAVLTAVPWPGARIEVATPAGTSRIDAEGYFRLCITESQLAQLKASDHGFGIYYPTDETGQSVSVAEFPVRLLSTDRSQAGVIRIQRRKFRFQELDAAPSLMGKPIPGSEGIDATPAWQSPQGKSVLVCFWDVSQRPSRHCLTRLAQMAEELSHKGVAVLAVHAGEESQDKLNEWLAVHEVPFPVGIMKADVSDTRFRWGARSLPWLILTDADRIVRAEGFGVDELADKLAAVAATTPRPEGN